jgi:hypothetical protein
MILNIEVSTHPLEIFIPDAHKNKIASLFTESQYISSSPITSLTGTIIPSVPLSDFKDLLSYDYPISDSIMTAFLNILRESEWNIHYLDTNFHRVFSEDGWDAAYKNSFSLKTVLGILAKHNSNLSYRASQFLFLYIFMAHTGSPLHAIS